MPQRDALADGMQIFLLHSSVATNAYLMSDQHVVKILLEIVQLAYTAQHHSLRPLVWDAGAPPYKPIANPNHPLAVWVRAARANFRYCLDLAEELSDEYTRRFGRVHACKQHVQALRALPPPRCPPEDRFGGLTLATVDIPQDLADFPLCFGDDLPSCLRRNSAGQIAGVESHVQYYFHKAARLQLRWDRSYVVRECLQELFKRVADVREGSVSLSPTVDGYGSDEDRDFLDGVRRLGLCEDCGSLDDGYCACCTPGREQRELVDLRRSNALGVELAVRRTTRRRARLLLRATRLVLAVVRLARLAVCISCAPGGGEAERAAKRFRVAAEGACATAVAHVAHAHAHARPRPGQFGWV